MPGDLKCQCVDIEQIYLKSDFGIERVRKRGQKGNFTYTHTIKQYLGPGKNVEKEQMISGREYLNLLQRADKELQTVKKKRFCFLWENQYFELDCFDSPKKDLVVLEAELENDSDSIALPPFLEVEREVTNEPEYSNYEIARSGLWL